MRRTDVSEDEELGELEDQTEALTIRSKRTERAKKKQAKKAKKISHQSHDLSSLPYELLLEILVLLRPSDVFNLQRASKAFRGFILQEEHRIARAIISRRYVCLEKCFRVPVLMEHMDPNIHPYVHSLERQEQLIILRKPYQHIQNPDPAEVCTCMTCVLRWAALCLVVDFAHWQQNLNEGEPIPMILRGKYPIWNQDLIASNAAIVRKALRSPLWHTRILESHLSSTVGSIRRHTANMGNKRYRFRMSKEEMESGSDLFLERSGPPSVDLPFHRDDYYLLEAYLPNRCWMKEQGKYLYVPAEQHDMDVRYMIRWAESRHKAATEVVGYHRKMTE
ncbi:hypothetical protein GGR54DRAFT_641376 [Hypoxylon sp. NC1633]|nr:hypothetical protein GGR54DRAFT_641376 [Hypoxylon sp. NC1633]